MTVAMKGRSGRWHVFRGGEARAFLGGIYAVGRWPVAVNLKGHGVEKATLWLTDQNACVLTLDNDNVPEAIVRAIYNRAVQLAEDSERKKSAVN